MLVVGTRRGDSDSLLSDILPKLRQLLGVWCARIGLTEIPYIVQNNYNKRTLHEGLQIKLRIHD